MPDHNYTITQLERLHKLKEQKAISEEEFAILKKGLFPDNEAKAQAGEITNEIEAISSIRKRNIIVSVGGLLLIVGGLFFHSYTQPTSITISQKRFEQMMLSNDVQTVVLVPTNNMVEITLKNEALKSNKYKVEQEARRSFFTRIDEPHYQFKIISVDNFDEKFREIVSQMPESERIGFSVDTR